MIFKHVDYGPLICCPPAFQSADVDLTCFWAEADRDKLDYLCKRVLSDPTGGALDYVALGRYVMLGWGQLDAFSIRGTAAVACTSHR